jgi:hypothetical protein
MDATAHQIVTIANGQRKVLETVGSLEAALTAQGTTYAGIPTRIIELEVDFDPTTAAHLAA